jgi:HD-like signal output (HDOD) protein/CheY-like chemotaxis protein
METRILFVDDDTSALAGLQRLLRPMRGEWSTSFVSDARQALDLLAAQPFDVVVTDMRMPDMDGSQLLQAIASQYPHVVRMVLSGEADRDVVLRAADPTHEYLSKPCDPDLLRSRIAHACALRQQLSNPSVRDWVASIKALPILPSLYVELLGELRSPRCSAARIGELVARDAGMTARILQLVNSAFFGVPGNISSPVQAVQVLGVDTIGALVIGARIFTQCDSLHARRLMPDQLWAHSVGTSRCARAIAAEAGGLREVQADASTAGLLHVCGVLVLACALRERYSLVVEQATREGRALWEVEREVLGSDHAEVGAYLLGLWGLPDAVVDAVRWHLRPGQSGNDAVSAVTAVHVANVVDHERGRGLASGVGIVLDDAYLARLDAVRKLPVWRAACASAERGRAA